MQKIMLLLVAGLTSAGLVQAEEAYTGPMTDYALENGPLACLEEIRVIDKFLNDGKGENGAWSFSATEQGQARMFNAINLKPYDDGTWGYNTISVSPGINGNCDGSVTTIVTFPNQSCTVARETIFKDVSYQGELTGKALYAANALKTVFEELNGGCIVIRQESLYPVPTDK